jgi:hypothetical protein
VGNPGIPNTEIIEEKKLSITIDNERVLLGTNFQKLSLSLTISIVNIPENNSMSNTKVWRFDD